jgi:transposase
MTTLADRLMPDQLWQRIQPLLPLPPSHARGGAPRTVPDRACMAAIIFMARTSTLWALLPVGEFGCGSVTTCWRRFSEWAAAGVFEGLQELLLDELGQAGALDWSRISVVPSACGRSGGDLCGANPVDRAKPGCKLHLAVEGGGLPLSLLVTGANTNDSLVFEALLDDLPNVRTPAGGRRCRPEKVYADKAYDHHRCRGYLTRRGIKVRIARRGIESSQRLGRHRWKAERSIAWLAGCRRLRIRYDRDSKRFFAFARHAGLRAAGLQPASRYRRGERTVTLIKVPEYPNHTNVVGRALLRWSPMSSSRSQRAPAPGSTGAGPRAAGRARHRRGARFRW